MIEVLFADILQQDVDTIVNPANRHMLHGGGLAGVIAHAGGPKLIKESSRLAPIKTGEAIHTSAGNLPFKGVIHTVGPYWEGDGSEPYWKRNDPEENADELLRQAHVSALEQAVEHGYSSVAFPAVSCGVFRFPVKRAAPIAMAAVKEAQDAHPEIRRVVFCLLSDDHYDAFIHAYDTTHGQAYGNAA